MPRRGRRQVSRRAFALFVSVIFATASHAEESNDARAGERSLAPWADPARKFGALAFTADGSFASVWQVASRAEAEARVRDDCLRYERGACEVVSFGATVCAAIATAQIAEDRKITYSGGGLSRDEAEETALKRCKRDKRSKETCELRTVVCGDGR